jgi:hypothetical protein
MKSRFLLNRAGDSRFLGLDSRVLVNKHNKRRHHPMATKDGFPPEYPIPLFLSYHAEEPEQPGIGKACDRAVISSRILEKSMLVATAAATVFAILSVGNPTVLFEDAMASVEPTAGAQALPPTARDAPTRDEIAAAFKTAYQSQTEIDQPPAEALLKQFQAWAAEQDARAQVRLVQSSGGLD